MSERKFTFERFHIITSPLRQALIYIAMDGTKRADIRPGIEVRIVLKKDQRTGNLTEGIVKDILTSSPTHHRGIKVRLTDGQIGRVREIVNP